MKLRLLSLAAASIAVVALAQDGVTLRRAFTANSEDAYVCEFSGTNNIESPAGPMEFKLKGSNNMIIKYKDVKETGCDIDLVTKDMKFEMEGMEAMGGGPDTSRMPKEITVPGKLDARNRVTFEKAAKGLDPMMQSMLSSLSSTNTGFFVEFPEGPVKVGDTWEIAMPKTTDKAPDVKLKAALVADKGNAWEVSVGGKFPMKMDMSQMAEQTGGMEMVMNMTMDSAFTVLVDKATGKSTSVNGKIDSTMKLEITSMNMTIPGTGKMTFTAKLK